MNLEKIIEWGAIILVVILGARWLGGLFGTGDPVTGMVGPQMGYPQPYGGYLSNGVIVMQPGIMGPGGRRTVYGGGRGRRR
jgi:hypothetical protein